MPLYHARLQQVVHYIIAKDSFTIILACTKNNKSYLVKNKFGLLYLKKAKYHKIGFIQELD